MDEIIMVEVFSEKKLSPLRGAKLIQLFTDVDVLND